MPFLLPKIYRRGAEDAGGGDIEGVEVGCRKVVRAVRVGLLKGDKIREVRVRVEHELVIGSLVELIGREITMAIANIVTAFGLAGGGFECIYPAVVSGHCGAVGLHSFGIAV